MPLNVLSQDEIVQDAISAIQAKPGNQFEFPIGSVVRAIVEAHGRTALWLESLAQYVLSITRLSTSTGPDVDSFVADFGLTRLPAIPASGSVNFNSFSANQERFISPFSSTVTTSNYSVTFQVTIDPDNEFWDAGLLQYVIPVNTFVASIPVVALQAGIIGNVGANQISVINSPIPGIDTVSNPLSFINGVEKQTDGQLKQYFVEYLGSLSRATLTAIQFAIQSVQSNLFFTIQENVDYTTQTQRLGYFYAIVDDGTGDISPELYANVVNSIDKYRGLTIMFEVQRPLIVDADIDATINLPFGFSSSTLVENVQNALINYINSIPMGGGTLFYNRLFQVIYNVILTEINNNFSYLDQFSITGVTINGTTSDLVSTAKQAIRPGTLNITTNP